MAKVDVKFFIPFWIQVVVDVFCFQNTGRSNLADNKGISDIFSKDIEKGSVGVRQVSGLNDMDLEFSMEKIFMTIFLTTLHFFLFGCFLNLCCLKQTELGRKYNYQTITFIILLSFPFLPFDDLRNFRVRPEDHKIATVFVLQNCKAAGSELRTIDKAYY